MTLDSFVAIDPAVTLAPEAVGRRSELAALVLRRAPQAGTFATEIDSLTLVRCDHPTPMSRGVQQPSLCIIAQGRKEVYLGEESWLYDPLHYLVVSVTLPLSGRVIEATPEEPYLCLRLDIDPAQIASLLAESGPMGVPASTGGRGLYVQPMEGCLIDAVLRLTHLLDTPKDIAMLAPMVIKEIFYRLLRGPQGYRLHQIAIADSQSHRVSRAIEWLNINYAQPLRIDELARSVNLSASTLHHRFKEFTAMSPLQFQKQLRLQEARRLMLGEGLEAAAAGYRVGYESPSQFSREYSRLFGAPPLRDLARLRSTA